MASPFASNAGEAPLPQSGTMLTESLEPVQEPPPLSVNASMNAFCPTASSRQATRTRP
jgi:hypothetical protein